MPSRQLTVYEKNQLIKFGHDPVEIDQYGEMPVEYITGKAIFLGQVFTVGQTTLIPRVETEELVEKIQADILKQPRHWQKNGLTALDVGTGCGVIGVTMAQFFERQSMKYRLIMSDISTAALEIAKQNVRSLLPTPQRGAIEFLLSDLLTSWKQKQSVNFIFANVPYVPRRRILILDNSVKDFEPIMALDGGEDGLQYITLLLEQAKTVLKPGGKVYLEVDDTHTWEKLRPITRGYDYKLINDQFGRNRFCFLTLRN